MLKDKVIIVTGGSGLIGQAIVKDIRNKGGFAINADIAGSDDLENGEISIDITDAGSIRNVVNRIVEKFGRLDGLVNNAYPRTKDWGVKFEDIPEASWKQNVDMQMNSYFVFSRIALEQMMIQNSGTIVNIGSTYGVVAPDFEIYGDTGMTSPAAYSAIKGGIINFTRYLASYYGKYHIRINSVSPGGIFDHQPDVFVRNYENRVPLKRMGKPEDIAPAVSFLLSDEAGYITGHNLMVDGGWTAI